MPGQNSGQTADGKGRDDNDNQPRMPKQATPQSPLPIHGLVFNAGKIYQKGLQSGQFQAQSTNNKSPSAQPLAPAAISKQLR